MVVLEWVTHFQVQEAVTPVPEVMQMGPTWAPLDQVSEDNLMVYDELQVGTVPNPEVDSSDSHLLR